MKPGKFHKAFDKATDLVYGNLTRSGINIVSVTKTPGGNVTVYWVGGALWFTAMDGEHPDCIGVCMLL